MMVDGLHETGRDGPLLLLLLLARAGFFALLMLLMALVEIGRVMLLLVGAGLEQAQHRAGVRHALLPARQVRAANLVAGRGLSLVAR